MQPTLRHTLTEAKRHHIVAAEHGRRPAIDDLIRGTIAAIETVITLNTQRRIKMLPRLLDGIHKTTTTLRGTRLRNIAGDNANTSMTTFQQILGSQTASHQPHCVKRSISTTGHDTSATSSHSCSTALPTHDSRAGINITPSTPRAGRRCNNSCSAARESSELATISEYPCAAHSSSTHLASAAKNRFSISGTISATSWDCLVTKLRAL